jgi:hypothetical protein
VQFLHDVLGQGQESHDLELLLYPGRSSHNMNTFTVNQALLIISSTKILFLENVVYLETSIVYDIL